MFKQVGPPLNNRIGLNLASGVNESFGNENCLWFNGVLYPVSDVLFRHQDEGHSTIRSLDEKLNLYIKTGWRRYENLNLRLVGSQFSQWQAKISGTIQQDDQEPTLDELPYLTNEQRGGSTCLNN